MKKARKIIILLTVFTLLIFSFVPKKNDQVEAFAITSTALAVGAIATLIVGGAVVSQSATESFGNDIINHVAETGQNISDFLNFDNRTQILNLVTSAVILNSIRDVTKSKVNEIDTATNAITNSTSLNYSIRHGSDVGATLSQTLNISNPSRLKSLIESRTPLTFTMTISSPLVTDMSFVIGTYIGNRQVVGTSFWFDKGAVGHQEFVQTSSGSSSTLLPGSHTHSVGDLVVVALPDMFSNSWAGLIDYTFSNFSIRESTLSIPVDTIDQFGNVARDSEQLQERINSQVRTNTQYSYAIPTDITTVRDLPSIQTNVSTPEMEVPHEDAPSGIFAIVYNIWQLLRSIPSRVANAFVGLFEYVVNAIVSFMEMIQGMFTSLMQSIHSIGSDIVSTLWNLNISGAISSASGQNSTMIGRLMSMLGNLVGPIPGAFTNGLNTLTDVTSDLWADAGAIWTGLGDKLTELNDTARIGILNGLENIANGIDNVRSYTGDLLSNLSIGIDNIRDYLVNMSIATGVSIGQAADRIADQIGTITTGLSDALVNVFVPSQSIVENMKIRSTSMNNEFKRKFEFITVPIGSMRRLFLQPKSLFDVTMELQGEKIYVLPAQFKSSVNIIRPVLTGVIVMLTFIGIYKKIQGAEVI